MKRTIMPICCFCLAALLGIGLWQGDFFNSKPPITLDDSTIIGEKDTIDDANVKKHTHDTAIGNTNVTTVYSVLKSKTPIDLNATLKNFL